MPTLQSSKKQNMYRSYSRKQIAKAVKFFLRKFGGLAFTLLKRCYLTALNWYAKLHQQNARSSPYANASVHTRQPPPDIRFTPQEWKPNSELSLKHDDLYARAWEYDDEKPTFDADKNNAAPPKSPEIPIQFDLSTEETQNTPRTAQECSPEVFSQTEQLCDVTDTYPEMELDEETSSEQPNNSSTDPRSSKYNLRHNPKPYCNDDYRY